MTSVDAIVSKGQWAKSPMHLMRSDTLHRVSRDWKPSAFLEMGAGTGSLSQEFVNRGFSGTLFDIGEQTCARLRARFSTQSDRVRVIESLDGISAASVDYLFAFEVLEHIADDRGALASWTPLLRQGGRILMSVPAHARKFGPSDQRVGHVRRYEREQLRSLLESAGYTDVGIACYGFPLGTMSRIVGNVLQRGSKPELDPDPVARSIDSGMRQSEFVLRLGRFLKPWMLSPFLLTQRLAYANELGEGYVAWGRRGPSSAISNAR